MNKIQKKIAICCPVYNCLEFTKEFVNSIKTKHDYQIIIFDNGSTDGTYEWLMEQKLNGKEIRILHSDTNLGISIGANSAMRAAIEDTKITHVVYSNNDVIMRPETIDAMVWAWDNRQDKRIVRIAGVDVRESNFKTKEECLKYVFNYDLNKTEFIFGGSYTFFIWDKSAVEKVGLLDETIDYYDDNVHAEEILRRGCVGVTFLPGIVFHASSATLRHNKQDEQKFSIKNRQDQEYAYKYFGVSDDKGIRDKYEERRPYWTPILKEISGKLKQLPKEYL